MWRCQPLPVWVDSTLTLVDYTDPDRCFAWLEQLCPTLSDGTEVVLNCSGRGDKDVNAVAERLGNALGA